MNKQTTLKVTGMHCSGCAANVERVLKRVKGVSSASVNLSAGQATIDYDPAVTNEKDFTTAVTKAGYGAG
jgi:copper chaperone CopZ